MGCCPSRNTEPDTVYPDNAANEETPLLQNAQPLEGDHMRVGSEQAAPAVQPDPKSGRGEKEMLKRIVQRTAEGLIDISSVRLLDRIQQDHAAERSNEYKTVLSTVDPILEVSLSKNASNQQRALANAPGISEDHIKKIMGTGGISVEQVDFVKSCLARVKAALDDGVRVTECGSVVVHIDQ
ncbi:hypothetical protein HDU78_007081 [Chytriomyces hyalinus]|nr:hypothetical protein HDU78_007081 [Chytriomyces hyalinus]KAJ3264462.1 hypothetical protein HDU77_008477 [Chytriomyces hyalinus]